MTNKRVKSRHTFREQGRSETVDTGKGVGREDVSISEVLLWLWLRPLLPSVPAPSRAVQGCLQCRGGLLVLLRISAGMWGLLVVDIMTLWSLHLTVFHILIGSILCFSECFMYPNLPDPQEFVEQI